LFWNSLPHSLSFCESITTLRKHLKTFYFQSAFPGAPYRPTTPAPGRCQLLTLALYKSIYLLTYLLIVSVTAVCSFQTSHAETVLHTALRLGHVTAVQMVLEAPDFDVVKCDSLQMHKVYNNNIIVIIRQFIRRRKMSMKSLQGHRTPDSRDGCRTAPDERRPLDQAHGLEPLARL